MLRVHFQLSLLLGMWLHFCLASNFPQSAQRRFMWKEMDSTVDAMRSMFSDLLPSPATGSPLPTAASLSGNLMDYMPSDTMRVKYIVRNSPPIKPMKIIKIRGSPKKVIKIMAMPKGHSYHLHHQQPHKYGHNAAKPQHHGMPSAEELRKLEKAQEIKTEAQYNNASEKPHDIVSGKIQEYNGWEPIYGETGKSESANDSPNHSSPQAAVYVTVKPFPMSKLHTSVIAEPLIQFKDHPDYGDASDEHDPQEPYDLRSPKNTYEVIEHTAEESVALPQTQGFHRSHSRTGFRPMHKSNAATSTTTTTTTAQPTTTASAVTTTTEEPPNYPAAYLRKMREREKERERGAAANAASAGHRFKHTDHGDWVPVSSNASPPSVHYPSLRLTKSSSKYPTAQRQSTEKWPPEMPKPRPFLSAADATVSHSESRQQKAPPTFESAASSQDAVRTTRHNTKVRGNSTGASTFKTETKQRQRGSIKFGDKINVDDWLK